MKSFFMDRWTSVEAWGNQIVSGFRALSENSLVGMLKPLKPAYVFSAAGQRVHNSNKLANSNGQWQLAFAYASHEISA